MLMADTDRTHFLLTVAGRSGELLQQWQETVSGPARLMLEVAGGPGRTAVDVVVAADGLHTTQGRQGNIDIR